MYNVKEGLQVISPENVLGVQSPAIGFLHEFAHVVFGSNEEQATAFETIVARDLGEPIRANYDAHGTTVRVDNSTQHTENGQWKSFEKNGAIKSGAMYDGSNHAPSLGTGFGPVGPPMSPGNPGNGWNNFPFTFDDHTPIDVSYPIFPGQSPGTGNKLMMLPIDFEISHTDSSYSMAVEHSNDAEIQIVGIANHMI